MKNSRIIALPSKVILSDGNVVMLDDLDEKSRDKIQSCICKNISKNMSNYYSSHRDEWKQFLDVMSK